VAGNQDGIRVAIVVNGTDATKVGVLRFAAQVVTTDSTNQSIPQNLMVHAHINVLHFSVAITQQHIVICVALVRVEVLKDQVNDKTTTIELTCLAMFAVKAGMVIFWRMSKICPVI